MNRIRKGLVGLLAATVMLSLGACARGSETSGETADGTVTLNGDRVDFAPGYEAAGKELVKLGASNLEARDVPSVDNYQQIIRSSLQTESTTDLVKWWSGYRLKDLARTGGLADLTPEWDKAVEEGWVNPDTKESYSSDGKVYAMPMYKSYWVIYYNKKVFKDAGVQPPTTWDEFISNNKKIKAAGVTPLFGTQEGGWTSFIWLEEILTKLDPEFYVKLMNNEAKWTDPVVTEAFEIWSDLYDQGFMTSADTAWDNEPAMLQQGEVAQVPMGTWRNGLFVSNGMTEDDYGAYLLPAVKSDVKPSIITESGVIAVAEKGKNKEAAKKTMGTWLNPDVQKAWVDVIKDTSANPKVVADDPILESVVGDVNDEAPMELERFWEAGPPPFIEGAVQYLGAFMANPTKKNIAPTQEKLQKLSDAEWAKWDKGQ